MTKNITINQLDSLLKEVKNNMGYPNTYGFIGGCVGVAKTIAKFLGKDKITILYDRGSWKKRKNGNPIYRTITHAVVEYKGKLFDYSGLTSKEEIKKRLIGRHNREIYEKKKKRMEKGTAAEHIQNQFKNSTIVESEKISLRGVSKIQKKLLNKNDELKPFLRHYKEKLRTISSKKKKSLTDGLMWR